MLMPQSRPMWLSKFRPDRDRQGRERPRRRLAVHSLECLEDRTVLSSISVASGDTAGLYAAIAAANATTGPATVNIQLSPGTYKLKSKVNSGELDITRTSGAVTIHGNGATIDPQGGSRVLETDAGTTVTVQDAELTDGTAVRAFGAAGVGGGILNLGGSLSLNHVILDNDTAQGPSGFPPDSDHTGGAGLGGGLSLRRVGLDPEIHLLPRRSYGGGGSGSLIGGAGARPGRWPVRHRRWVGLDPELNFSSDLAQGGPVPPAAPAAPAARRRWPRGGAVHRQRHALPENSSVSNNVAQGGAGGSGANGGNGWGGGRFVRSRLRDPRPDGYPPEPGSGLAGEGGSNGAGIGGGLYVATGASVSLKKTIVALNFASTSNDNIYGTVTYL